MKIKTKVLTTYLKKVKMGGNERIDEALFKFDAVGISVRALTKAQQIMVEGTLKAEAFEDYKAIGYIGLGNLDSTIKILDRFDETIDVVRQGSGLLVSAVVEEGGEKKSVVIPLYDEGQFDKNLKSIQIKHENNFILSSDTLKSIIEDAAINKDFLMSLSTKDGAVIFTNTGEYKFERTIEAPGVKGGKEETKVEFGGALVEATTQLKGTVLEIGIKSNFPAKIVEKTDLTEFTFIVSPFVNKED